MGKKHKSKKRKSLKQKCVKLPQEDLDYLVRHTKLTDEEIVDWHRSFLKECPKGVLTKIDLHAMYTRLIPNEDPSTLIDQLFRIFDRDESGTIDFKEFVLATDITTTADPEEKLRWTFKLYDKDGSGTIEISEMEEILNTIYVMEGIASASTVAKTHASQMFKDLDQDENGSISLEEFIEGCLNDRELISLIRKDDEAEEVEGNNLPVEKSKKSNADYTNGLSISGQACN